MNLNEWTLNQAAGLLNEDFAPLCSTEHYSTEEIRKIMKQREMLHEETDSDSSLDSIFETLTKTRDVWLKELQETTKHSEEQIEEKDENHFLSWDIE